MHKELVSFKQLGKWYGKDVTIFEDVNITMETNKIIGLLGENGSGKTTFIKLIGGMIMPDKGEISILGDKMKNESDIIRLKEKVSILGDANRSLYWNLTGMDNIKYFWCLKTGKSVKEIDNKVYDLIEQFNMNSFINKRVESYSKGMKQRLLLVIALLNSPKLLIMDEPLNGLDFENCMVLKALIKDYVEKKDGSVLLTSHDANFINELCDVKYQIKDKNISKVLHDKKEEKKMKIYFKQCSDCIKMDLSKYDIKPTSLSDNIKSMNININDSQFYHLLSEEISNKTIEVLDII